MRDYIHVPNSIKWQEIVNNNFTLSSSQYVRLVMPNKNYKLVKDFLTRPLDRTDLGFEIGSLNYIDKSPYRFIRTKALQEHSYLPNMNKETALPIMPSVFVNMDLKEGDLLISKDSNIGEIVILDKDYPRYMLSGAIYRLPVQNYWRYYLLALLKHNIFREQLDYMVPKGATIRHAKTLFLDCQIPLPNRNTDNVVRYISLLTQSIVNKEKCIRQRHEAILKLIEQELTTNQSPNLYSYKLPRFNDIKEFGRLDTGIYCDVFKNNISLIKNYKYGYYSNIFEMGYKLSRGQNLQESNIGKSIYLDYCYKNFYSLALPTNFSEYGTIEKTLYLGNPNKLKTISEGEIIFGAEATFRGFVVCDKKDKYITNIHGVTIANNGNIEQSIMIKCFLDYLVHKGVIDCVKVGGHGGSFAQKYWDIIPFPKIPEIRRKEIAVLYHNPTEYNSNDLTINNFMEKDIEFNSYAGIYELDKSVKQLKLILKKAIDNIVNDRDVNISFV